MTEPSPVSDAAAAPPPDASAGAPGFGVPAASSLAPGELRMVYALNFGRTFVVFLLYHKFPLLFEELGFTGAQRGDLFSVVPAASLLATFWVGVISDRVDARFVTALGLILVSAFLAGVVATRSFWPLLALFAVSGVANQCYTVGTNAYLFKNVGRGSDTSIPISRFSASSSFGIAAAFLVGPPLVAGVGLDATLWCGALVSMALVPLLWALRPALAERRNLGGYFALFRQPRVALFSVMIFLFALHWGAETTCYSPFLRHHLRIPEERLGLFMGPPILVLGASTLAFGHLGRRRVGPRATLTAAFLLSGLGAVMMASSTTVAGAFVWRLVHEAGDGAYFLFMLGGIHRLFSEDRAGGCAGLVWFVAMAAAALGSALSAPLAETYGYAVPQFVAGALALVSLVGVPFLDTTDSTAAAAT